MVELLNSLFKNPSLTRKIRERGTARTISQEFPLRELGGLWHLAILAPVLIPSSEISRDSGTITWQMAG